MTWKDAVAEESILRPRDPKLDDTNDWPEYSLRKFHVVNDAGHAVSLLSAHSGNPVRVYGQLEKVESEQRSSGKGTFSRDAVYSSKPFKHSNTNVQSSLRDTNPRPSSSAP